jgi:hypothetical protein
MASQKANTNFSIKNNGGSVINAGATDSGVLSDLSLIKNLGSGLQAYGTSVFSDTPTAPFNFNDPRGVIKARSVNPFAYTPPAGSGYLLIAAGDNASTIGGSGTTLLNIPGGATEAVVNKNLKTTQLGSYATRKFDVLAVPSSGNSPGLTRGTGAGTAVTYRATSGNLYPAVDDAASLTRAVPGELTYRFGAALPTRNVAYKAKDSNE